MGESGEAQASPAAELIDFTLERGRHRRFVGREDVLARLDEWLLGPDDTGWVVVTGGPGMGKSALLSRWLDRHEAAGAVVPHHFVRRQVIDWDQPERIAASLAAQIEAMFPDQRDARAKPEGRLPELLGRVSKQLGASGRLVLVVDGLDETRAEPGENPLPRFLPHVVPAGIRILCAMRPTYPHLGWIEARSPARRVNLDDDQWASSNEAVVRGFWEAVRPDYQPPLPPSTVAAAIARAGGNVLHAVMLHDVLRGLPPVQRRAERIPGGLRHLIGEVRDLVGHAGGVTACAVTPDGRRVVSASYDRALKVWDLSAGACLLTHRANATCHALATTATAIIAGDATGAVWFFDWPPPDARRGSAQDDRRPDNQLTPSSDPELRAQRPPRKHTILFLAANPLGTDRVALDREARAIQVELERSGFRDRFELVTRWAAEPLDLLRELRKLKPTVVHFSGHGTADVVGRASGPGPHRDVDIAPGHDGGDPRPGLFFQGPDGGPQLVSTEALEATFGAAGSSVQLIVLSACYSELNAQALLRHVGCVVGMSGAIADDAARSFAIGFYGGLGERESIAAAYAQGCAAIRLQGLSDHDRPELAVRAGIDAGTLVLAADPVEAPASQGDADTAGHSAGAAPTPIRAAAHGEPRVRALLGAMPLPARATTRVNAVLMRSRCEAR